MVREEFLLLWLVVQALLTWPLNNKDLKMNQDLFFKVLSAATSLIIIPLFIWIWNTNNQLQEVTIQLDHAKAELKELKGTKTDIQLIKKDIEFIKENVKDLKNMLKENK